METYNYSFKTPQTVTFDNELEEPIKKFRESYQNIKMQGNWQDNEIHNMDETGISIEINPTKIITQKRFSIPSN